MLALVPLTWFFLFKFLNQGTLEANDFFLFFSKELSAIKGAIIFAGIVILCLSIFNKKPNILMILPVFFLLFTLNSGINDFTVRLYNINLQLQTILNSLHPVLIHTSLGLSLGFLWTGCINLVFWAWALAGLALILGSVWAFTELGWGSFWFYDPIETYSFLYWLLLSFLIPAHIKNYPIRHAFILAILFFFVYPRFLLNSSLHNFNDSFTFETTIGSSIKASLALIVISLLMLGSSREGIKDKLTPKTRIEKIKVNLIFSILVFGVSLSLIPSLEDPNISRLITISATFYLILSKNTNHSIIGHFIFNVFLLQTLNSFENTTKNNFIALKEDEWSSEDHFGLSNSTFLTQVITDFEKMPVLLKTKEIYFYTIIDYMENTPTDNTIIWGFYALMITHVAVRVTRGL